MISSSSLTYTNDIGVKHTARDVYGKALLMPEVLSKYICDLARVKLPSVPIGKDTLTCAICFNRRPHCNKLEHYRYCKGCYQEYTSNGGFNWENSYEETMKCVKCENPKRKGYKNTPLCIPCFDYEKRQIYKYHGKTKCGCGNSKASYFPFCMDCNLKGKYNEAKQELDVRLCEIIKNFNSRSFQIE